MSAFIAAFAALGFQSSDSAEPVPGIEKVEIFARDGVPTHAARQLPSGRWTSKLGAGPDIEHDLEDITGEIYGVVAAIMLR